MRRTANRRTPVRVSTNGRSAGIFAIEDAQRIALQPAPRFFAQLGRVRPKMIQQRLAVDAAGQIASPMELTFNMTSRKSVGARQFPRHRDDLDVGLGAGRAKTLDAELVRLPVTALLRTLVAEDRTDVKQARLGVEQPPLERGAHDRRGTFRTQRHSRSPLSRNVYISFFDDVGRIADAAYEQLGRLERRRANLAVAETIAPAKRTDTCLEFAPSARIRRDDSLRSARAVTVGPWAQAVRSAGSGFRAGPRCFAGIES